MHKPIMSSYDIIFKARLCESNLKSMPKAHLYEPQLTDHGMRAHHTLGTGWVVSLLSKLQNSVRELLG
jgi:hypothetical protein